jgi:hypothetical protein
MSEETGSNTITAVWRYFATCRNATERDRRNARRATWWLFAWAVSYVAVKFGLVKGVVPEGALSVLAVTVPIVLGLIAVLGYVRLVRQADELQRKIQLEAMALGFGGAFLGNFGLDLLERVGVPVSGGDLFVVAAAFYILGIILGARRYA